MLNAKHFSVNFGLIFSPNFLPRCSSISATADRLLACEKPASREQAAANASRLRHLLGENKAAAAPAAWLEKTSLPSRG